MKPIGWSERESTDHVGAPSPPSPPKCRTRPTLGLDGGCGRPTAQTSVGPVPQIELIGIVASPGVATAAHMIALDVAPVPWKRPSSPPAQRSVGPLPQMARRRPGTVCTIDHDAPSHRRMLPCALTAHATPRPSLQTSRNVCGDGRVV